MSIISYEQVKERIEELIFIFKAPKSLKEHLEIVFVFGGTSKNLQDTTREQFLSYAISCDTPFKFITIEAIYNDLKEFSNIGHGITAKRTALVELELYAIKQSYSLVIFPESVGSYAELGYFTAIPETKAKIYVANHYDFASANSYLNHIIDVIHNNKDIRPLLMDFKSATKTTKFEELITNLTKDYTNKHSSVRLTESELFPLSVTYEIIKLLPTLTYKQLQMATEMILKEFTSVYKSKNFTTIISILVVSDLIRRVILEDFIYFTPVNSEYSLLDIKLTEREKARLLFLQLQYKEEGEAV
ncbi:MAG: retron St85 family effector protein [Sulfurimonas sp.]|uniref:retron St85 family effector protein n=1 Tax=Sulfurimonas sp. TaxID=2022749 RepID=UPI00261DCA34|nr:retron St85 family effector protein [Sulfurimonas sp.]MDD5400928.1 retron St85 family effector protein [Sulfurimonas sp.]